MGVSCFEPAIYYFLQIAPLPFGKGRAALLPQIFSP